MIRIPYEELEFDDTLYYHNGQPFTGVAFEQPEGGRVIGEIQYRYGVPDGIKRLWYDNGQPKREINYKLNIPHGVEREWFVDGRPKAERQYELGVLLSEREWDPEGELVKEYKIEPESAEFKRLEQRRQNEEQDIRAMLKRLGIPDSDL